MEAKIYEYLIAKILINTPSADHWQGTYHKTILVDNERRGIVSFRVKFHQNFSFSTDDLHLHWL